MTKIKKINHPSFSPVQEREETSREAPPRGQEALAPLKVPLVVRHQRKTVDPGIDTEPVSLQKQQRNHTEMEQNFHKTQINSGEQKFPRNTTHFEHYSQNELNAQHDDLDSLAQKSVIKSTEFNLKQASVRIPGGERMPTFARNSSVH
jgi:hypothetical protein